MLVWTLTSTSLAAGFQFRPTRTLPVRMGIHNYGPMQSWSSDEPQHAGAGSVDVASAAGGLLLVRGPSPNHEPLTVMELILDGFKSGSDEDVENLWQFVVSRRHGPIMSKTCGCALLLASPRRLAMRAVARRRCQMGLWRSSMSALPER